MPARSPTDSATRACRATSARRTSTSASARQRRRQVFLCQTAFNPDPTAFAPTCPQSGTVSGLLRVDNVIGPAAQGISATEFAEMVRAIRAGVAYVNVHSTTFPGGEIRGQLNAWRNCRDLTCHDSAASRRRRRADPAQPASRA